MTTFTLTMLALGAIWVATMLPFKLLAPLNRGRLVDDAQRAARHCGLGGEGL